MSKRKNKHIDSALQKAEPVFIHSLWRTGSTYLFSVFRRSASGYWCYQEPLHEITFSCKDKPEYLLMYTGDLMRSLRHPPLDKSYFFELYEIADTWKDVITKPVIYDQYFDTSCSDNLKKFLAALITHSKGRPVIQECRTSNRINPLKQAFAGHHIYLWRNPWDQWWSYKATYYFDITSQLILNTIVHPEAITRVRQEIGFKEFHHDDISNEFAHFDQIRLSAQDSYLVFYLIWCLGLLEGVSHSDLLINIDSLSDSAMYQIETCDRLSTLGIEGLDFSDCSVYQNHFTDQEKVFFESLEDRVHGLLLVSGYSQHHIDGLLEQRRIHQPASCRAPVTSVKPEALWADAERAREIVIRYETTYSEQLRSNAKLLADGEEQLQSVRDELSRQVMDAVARESVFTQQSEQKRQQLTQLLGNLAAREQEFGEQSLRAKEAAEQEKAELLLAYSNKEESLRKDLLMREEALRQELVDVPGTFTAREREFSEQSSQAQESAKQEKAELLQVHSNKEESLRRDFLKREEALRQELVDVLGTLAAREKEFGELSSQAQESAEQEKTELLRAYSAKEESLRNDFLKREESLRQELVNVLGTLAAREKEFGELSLLQSLLDKEAAEQEKAELLRAYSDKEDSLRSDFLMREESLRQELVNVLGTLTAREKEFGELSLLQSLLDKEAADQEKAELLQAFSDKEESLRRDFLTREDSLRQELVNLFGTLAAREQEFGEQILRTKEVAEKEKRELLFLHTEQEQALIRQQVQLEEALRNRQEQKIRDLQEKNRETLEYHQQQHKQFRESAASIENYLKQQIQAEQQAVKQLQQGLSILNDELDHMRSSFSWWFTAPFRTLANICGISERQVTHSSMRNHTPAESSIHSLEPSHDQIPLESISMTTSTIHENATAAKTIDELLSHYNEQFVRCAYLTLLGRPADEDGTRYYLGRLRAGYGKAKVITQLAESAEAKTFGANLAGLQEVIAAQKHNDHWFWRFFARSRRIERQGHRLECELENIALLQADSTRRLVLLERAVEFKANHLDNHIDRIAQLQSDATAILVSLEQAVGAILVSVNDKAADQLHIKMESELGKMARASVLQDQQIVVSERNKRENIHKSPQSRMLYYFVDHTVNCPVNTGMQRVVRRLGSSLNHSMESLRFVKWDENLKEIVLINISEFGHLSKWNGPEIDSKAISIYPKSDDAPVLIGRDKSDNHRWLIVPEVTHISDHRNPVTLDVISAAHCLGLKVAFIFYDATPLRRPELKSMSSTHAEYMQQLLLADLIVPISEWASADLVSYLKLHEHAKLASAPRIHALQLPGESQLSPRITKVSENKSGDKYILCVGSIVPHKNQLAFVRVFDRYCEEHPCSGWKLKLVGNLHPELSVELIDFTRKNEKIIYMGDVPDCDLDSLYRNCSFTVFPSVMEGFGLPILESLWYAKPCICANFGAMSEVAEGGGCLTVDTHDDAQIYEALVKLISDPNKLAYLSLEATKRHISDWQEYSTSFCQLLDEVSNPIFDLGHVYYWIDHTSIYPANSGIQRVVRSLARAMLELGIKLIPIKWDEDQQTIYPANEAELRHLEKWNGPSVSLWSDWKPLEKISPKDWLLIPELTHYLSKTTLENLRDFTKISNIRCAWIFYDAIPWKMKNLYPPEAIEAHRQYMLQLNEFQKVFAISNFSRNDLLFFLSSQGTRCGYLEDRVQTCLLPAEFYEAERITVYKEKTNVSTVRILCVGTVEPRKNHIRLLDALSVAQRLASRHIEIVIAGGDPFVELAIEVQQKIDLLPGSRWIRKIDDSELHQLYLDFDFTVYPSLEEGFGLPILESLWNALPCLCANFGAMAEVAKGGGCLTVDVSVTSEIAAGIRLLAMDDSLRKQLSEEAVTRKFKTWQDYGYEVATRMAEERLIVMEPLLAVSCEQPEQLYREFINIEPRPLLSICISTYNRAAWLSLSLKNMVRLLPFSIPEIEIVVCDNSSIDETPQIVSPYLNRSDFSYYRNPENVGMLGNLRVTAHHAKGQYIWILGDDDLIKPNCVERVITAIKVNLNVALIYLNYAYTRQEDAAAVTDLEQFLDDSTPITSPTVDLSASVRQICTQSENFFTAIYCLVFRRDHALRAYSQNTDGRPFSTMRTCIPTTYHVLNCMMDEPAYWIGEPLLVVNLNVSWMKYAPLWILERIPEVYDLAEKLGADPVLVDKWRVNNMPGVLHFFEQIYASDPEGNCAYFSAFRLVNRLKHLKEFWDIVPKMIEIYDVAHYAGNASAVLPSEQIFEAFSDINTLKHRRVL